MYNVSPLFFYRPQFMAELIIAEALLISALKFKKGAWYKILIGCVLCFGLAFAIPVSAFTSFYASIMFSAMFVATLIMWKIVLDEPIKKVIFATISGYTIQHIAHEIYELVMIALRVNDSSVGDMYGNENIFIGGSGTFVSGHVSILAYLIYFQIFLFVYFLCYKLLHNKMPKGDVKIGTPVMVVFIIFILLIDVVFGTIVIYSLPANIDVVAMILLRIYNISCCIIAITLLLELNRRGTAEYDLLVMEQIKYREQEQYSITKENIDLINIKCHDLKHYIRALAKGGEAQKAELAELEELVEIYDSAYTTENVALSVVLSEKGLTCKNLKIKLSCIVDASGLSFMSETDVYSLFGNVLDNAIDAVQRLEEDERTIGFSIKTVGDFVVINVYNGYTGKIKFVNGLPQTNKTNKNYHGFGFKSVQRIVNKYGGEIQIKAQDGVFDLTLLFQLDKPENA